MQNYESDLHHLYERVYRAIVKASKPHELSIQNAGTACPDTGDNIGTTTAGTTTAAPPEAAADDDGGDDDGEDDWRRPRKHHPSKALAAHPSGIARTGTRNAAKNPQIEIDDSLQLWRLPTVLEHIPVSKSGWHAGVKAGIYPAPLRIGPRAVAWRACDIRAFINSLAAQ